jgi:PST family polysaccharide transporter
VTAKPQASAPLGTRVLRGSGVMLLRTIAVYGATTIGAILLTKVLTPSDFGAYSIVYNASMLVYAVANAGFAQVFIREQVFDEDVLDAAFWAIATFCAGAGLLVIGGAWFLEPSADTWWLLAGLGAFLLLTPLRFPTLVACWRDVRLVPICAIEAGEVIVFEVVAVAAAYAGHGVRSFAYGLIAGAVAAAVASLLVQRRLPRRPRLAPVLPWLGPILPVQGAVTLSLARDSLSFPLLGLVAGTTVVGLYSWAFSVAALPVLLATITFGPMFSALAQLRDRTEEFEEAVGRGLRLVITAAIGLGITIAAVIEPIITVVFSPLWLPARETAWILLAGTVIYASALVIGQVAGVTGTGARSVTRWQLTSLGVYWVLGLPAAAAIGMEAFAAAYLGSSLLHAGLAYRFTGARHRLEIVRPITLALVAAVPSVALGLYVSSLVGESLAAILAGAAACATLFTALVLLPPRGLRDDVRLALRLVRLPQPG